MSTIVNLFYKRFLDFFYFIFILYNMIYFKKSINDKLNIDIISISEIYDY